MPTFPSYAKVLIDGFAEKRESALLRSDFEAGPPRQARVRSLPLVTRPVQIHLDSLADYQSFKTWFATDLNEGAAWFSWTDPVDGVTKNARFVGGGLDAEPRGTSRLWLIKAQIETWG